MLIEEDKNDILSLSLKRNLKLRKKQNKDRDKKKIKGKRIKKIGLYDINDVKK